MSSSSPKVSVVLSVYNNVDTVAAAIQSIQQQTLKDWELVVVNDGSKDESPRILDELAAADSRIRVIHQENTGLTRALIRGCREAKGEYIARLDADDLSLPERLAAQASLLDADAGVGFVSCWTEFFAPGGEVLEVMRRPDDSESATQRLLVEREGPPAHGSVMFRRRLYDEVGGYRPEFYYAQDADLWIRMAERSRIAYVPRALYSYRRDPEGISGALRAYQKQFGELGQLAKQARLAGGSDAEYVAQAARLTQEMIERRKSGGLKRSDSVNTNYAIGSQLAQQGHPGALGYLWKVVRRRPWHLKAWVRLVQARMRTPRLMGAPLSNSSESTRP